MSTVILDTNGSIVVVNKTDTIIIVDTASQTTVVNKDFTTVVVPKIARYCLICLN